MPERLQMLEAELEKGSRMLSELDQRRADLRDTLLRISGAIQVLRELSSQGYPGPAAAMIGDPR